jgi:MoxR-like ATPase
MSSSVEAVGRLIAQARQELGKRIIGQADTIDQLLFAVLIGGHALLEGAPGLAKTLLVRTLSELLQLRFQRIQATSDLMPADILGTNVLNTATGSFQLHQGPLFSDLVLVDEINRMPPRTQAALLEAMEERQVTIDGVRHSLDPYFTVFATQNPIEFEGTYPLPEAQLDRFLLKVVVPYPNEAEEVQILKLFEKETALEQRETLAITPLDPTLLAEARREVKQLTVEPGLFIYIARLVRATRTAPQISLGASPRAALNLTYVAKAIAAMDGRDYVIPDDVKDATIPVLRHRVILRPEAQLEGLSSDQVLLQIVNAVELPK